MLSLRNIECPEGLNLRQHNHILWFLSRLLVTNEGVKHYKNIFCFEENPVFKTLDVNITKAYKKEKETTRILKTKSMAKYMMGDEIEIRLLGDGVYDRGTYRNLEDGFISKHYLYPFFEDKGTISDNLLYMWNDLIGKIGVQVFKTKDDVNMYLKADPMDMYLYKTNFSFEYYLNFSRDELLKKEIELGYTNKIIGDPSRGYGYTHLLRANVGDSMVMPSSAIRLILNWSKYNTYLTSRKQGKTSFAADRIVAELLSEKGGYGMRKSRRIKFFTDNASKIGTEVFEFIKDFLGDLKNRELKAGVKYFDISNSNQEVRCNLTGNVFNIVSLSGLRGDTDNSTGDGLACDVAIIDEGFRITERFWRSFKDRAFEESDWILFLSTLNEETEITHWGYREMIKGECFFEGYNTVRSSDFDNTITYFNNFKNKGKSINAFYDYTWEKFYDKMKETSEGYVMKRMLCSIHSDKLLFNVAGRITGEDKGVDSDLRIIGIDPGGLHDHLGICVFNCMTCVVEESESLNIKYDDIMPKIIEYKSKYNKSIAVGDLGGPVGNTLKLLDTEGIIDYWIKTASSTSKSVGVKDGYSIINKGTFVINGAYMLHNIAMIHIRNNELIKQFGDIEAKMSTRSNTIMYEAKKGRKDDAVFSFLNIAALLRITLGLLEKNDIIEFASRYGNTEVYTYDDDTYYYTGNYIY